MKKILLLFIPFLLTGCYYTELNDLLIVDTIAIDKIDNEYITYISTIDTLNYKSEDDLKTNIYKAKGKTIEESINNLYLEINKTMYLSSINNLLFTNNLNNNDLKNITYFFIKDKTSRNTFNIIYIKESDIENILKDNINIKNLLITNNREFGNTSLYLFEDFYKDNFTISLVPTITYKDKIIIDNYSIFKKYTYIDTLTKDESIVYNILTNKISDINIAISINYIKVTNIHTTIINNNIKISSLINKNNTDIYNNYLRKNINILMNKYKLYDNYKLEIDTTLIKE